MEKDLSAAHEKICLLELSLRKIKFFSLTHRYFLLKVIFVCWVLIAGLANT